MSEDTVRKHCIRSLIGKIAAVALTAVFLYGTPGSTAASQILTSVSIVRADEADTTNPAGSTSSAGSTGAAGSTDSSSYSSPVYDYYIKVQSPDGTGVVLRKQPNTNSQALLTENIPDGTVLHITGQADDGNGGLWGFTNYSDVAEGYVLLQQTVTVEKDSLLVKEDPNAAADASVKAREQQLELYFQTVDENGNAVDGSILGTNDSSSSSSASSSSSSESVKSGSASEAVKASSAAESVSAVSATESLRASSGSESVRSSSGSLDSGTIAVGPLKLPKIALFGGVGAIAAVAVVLVLLKKKKKGSGDDADGDASGDKTGNAEASGREKARKGLKMSKSKPVKQAAADKMGKKKK